MTTKCACLHCQQNIEFVVAEFVPSGDTAKEQIGQSVPCPHCGQMTVLRMEKNTPQIQQFARKVKGDKIGTGVIVQIIGVALCVTVYGLVIGVPLIIWGALLARRVACSECGTILNNREVKLCPCCKTQFY